LPAAAEEEKKEKEESLDDELDELKEDDYPDLVGADEKSELMDEFALLAEEDIVYSAAKHKQEITESPSAITVITREQIEYTHCTDIICLLRQVAEVDVRRVLPAFPVVGARALTEDFGNKALVIVDGREVNFELFGVALWGGLPIHLEDIDRIEIIRGPGSALYGANAHSMVVSIITRKTTDTGAEAFLGSGEHDRSSLHLRLGLRLGDWRLHLSGGLDTASHWRIRNLREREIYRARLLLEHEADSATTTIYLGLMAADAPFYTELGPVRTKDTRFGNFFLSHQTDLWRGQLSLELADSDLLADMPLYWGETKLGDFPKVVDFFTSNLDSEAQLNWSPFDGNLLIAGGNYRWVHVTSGGMDPGMINQHRVGVFLHDEQRLAERLILTAGLRFDYNNITPNTLSPRVAGVWQFAENQFLRMAFGQAFRKPAIYETSTHFTGVKGTASFPELGEFFQRNIGNDHLGNEKSTTFEAGYRARFFQNRLTFETDLFYALYRNTISFQFNIKTDPISGLPDLNNSEMKFQNTGRDVDSLGGSVSLTYRVDNTWRFNANYTFRHSWYIADPPGGPAVGEGGKGNRVPWEPAHLVNLSFHYIPELGLRFGMALHGSSASDLALPEEGSLFGENVVVHNPPIYFVSGFVAWRLDLGSRWAEVGVRAFNLLNAGFRDLPAVPRPGTTELGGQLLGRRIFLFFRGSI
jgi:iron complex outermembrane receptor protein